MEDSPPHNRPQSAKLPQGQPMRRRAAPVQRGGFSARLRRSVDGIRQGRREDVLGAAILVAGFVLVAAVLFLLLEGTGGNREGAPVSRFGEADIAETEGVWITRIAGGSATLQARDGYYQIIYAPEGTKTRRFSRGKITEEGDYLIFTPRQDYGRPETEGFSYYGFGSAPFPVQAKKKGGELVWGAGPPEYMLPAEIRQTALAYGREKMIRLYGLKNPLFDLAGADYIVWEPLK